MEGKIDAKTFFESLGGGLNERTTRLVVSAAALGMGRGGIVKAAELSGLSRPSIYAGINELKDAAARDEEPAQERQRKEGGGRKLVEDDDRGLLDDLEGLLQPCERGDPESPLRWCSRSLRHLSAELLKMGRKASHVTVGRLLKKLGYTMQSNKKAREGSSSPDRNAQFEHINKTAEEFISEGQPIISVDAKKKELVGDFKNQGGEYRQSGEPEIVNAYDFPSLAKGRANPYGVYDLQANEGYVGVGTSRDTAKFAVETIEQWWLRMGREKYPDAHSLYITADGGGSNGSHNRLWKQELQLFADKHALNVYVSHFPPGTSKWNKIEHRMFSAISMNWRGKPLVSLEVIVSLIAATTTKTGLRILADIDRAEYVVGEKVSDDDMAKLNMKSHKFHPEWNYVMLHR